MFTRGKLVREEIRKVIILARGVGWTWGNWGTVKVSFACLFCFRGSITLILLGVDALQVVKVIGSILVLNKIGLVVSWESCQLVQLVKYCCLEVWLMPQMVVDKVEVFEAKVATFEDSVKLSMVEFKQSLF